MGYELDEHIERETLRYYLDRIDPYIGSPMLSAPLGVYAARLRDRSRATDLLTSGYLDFLTDPYPETNEFSNSAFPEKPRVGALLANAG